MAGRGTPIFERKEFKNLVGCCSVDEIIGVDNTTSCDELAHEVEAS
jgi:hypothetical protein